MKTEDYEFYDQAGTATITAFPIIQQSIHIADNTRRAASPGPHAVGSAPQRDDDVTLTRA